MSVVVTRSIQVVCILLMALSIFAILGSRGDLQLIGAWSAALGFALVIFLLATILRVISDVGEKLLLSAGYRREEKQTAGQLAGR